MIVRGASLPGGEPPGEDRWTHTETGVIVLDGATSVRPDVPPAGEYVDALLDALAETVDSPADTGVVLADAIGAVAAKLTLSPGTAPSSTVAVLRERGNAVEAAVLGDSTIVLGFTDGTEERLTDDRIEGLARDTRATLRDRLRAGSGYDHRHRELLRDVQAAEREARNTDGGYWIAEADARAGHHAIARSYPGGVVAWAVLATDGAQRVIDHQGVSWADLPPESADQLHACLRELHWWEASVDPDGRDLTRSKRHDDKTLVTWRPDPGPDR